MTLDELLRSRDKKYQKWLYRVRRDAEHYRWSMREVGRCLLCCAKSNKLSIHGYCNKCVKGD